MTYWFVHAYLFVNTLVTDEWLQNIKRLLDIPVNKFSGFSRVPRNVDILVCYVVNRPNDSFPHYFKIYSAVGVTWQ